MIPHLASVLDAFERSGKLNVRADEIRGAMPGVSPEGLRKALYRQQTRGRIVRLSRGAEHWLIVPLQHAIAGAPPLEAWLDHYLRKTLETPYYVGLLSAAETYGASPYAVMVTQVMVPHKRRPITVGRHEVVFHTRAGLEQMPTRWHESADGRFRVSTPELTALDLIQREVIVGGIDRVQQVLRALWVHCTPAGFAQALDAVQTLPLAQRLGACLAMDNQPELTASVQHWLHGKPLRLVSLESDIDPDEHAPFSINTDFKVRMLANRAGANT